MSAVVPDGPRTAPAALGSQELAEAKAAIVAVRPDLASADIVVHEMGWDSLALEATGTLFKLPRTEEAAERLRREPVNIAIVARFVPDLALPRMTLVETPRLMSHHAMVPGTMVDPATYHGLDEAARDRLAATLGAAMVALHRADPHEARAAGAVDLAPWPAAATLFEAARARLEAPLLARVAEVLGRVAVADPDGVVFGHFDTHGWNMAYDMAANRLVGLYDFGDAGLGPRHRDLSYPSFVSPDLTARIVRHYEALGGRPVDLAHVYDLHTVLRLMEVVNAGENASPFIWALTDWFAALDRAASDI